MPETPRRGPDDQPEVADANLLFGETAAPRKPAPPSPAPSRPAPTPTGEGYGLAGDDEPESDEPVAPIPVPIPQPAPRPRKTVALEERAEKTPSGPEATVDQVWSRGAEWGGTLVPMGLVALVMVGLLGWWVSRMDENSGFGFPALVVLIGGAALVLLSYPIVITLERPVRMTPEQAAKDYFGALSHHFPHYRRMWLLLSDQGRQSPAFDSFGAFKTYWKDRLKQIRGSQVKGTTPLTFTVANFPTEKSKGKNSLEANYTVHVHARDKPNDAPLESVQFKKAGFVKGPDNMWYLNLGTLPTPQASTARPGREPG